MIKKIYKIIVKINQLLNDKIIIKKLNKNKQLNDEIKKIKKLKKPKKEKKEIKCAYFFKSANNTQPISIKKQIAQGNLLHVTAQNPATGVVAGNSRGGILRVKTYFSTHFT